MAVSSHGRRVSSKKSVFSLRWGKSITRACGRIDSPGPFGKTSRRTTVFYAPFAETPGDKFDVDCGDFIRRG
jgi:hypothetical protein